MTTDKPPEVVEQHAERQMMWASQQDPSKFEPLYEAYFPRIYSYCRRRTNTDQQAEDLTSAVFIKALRNLPQYRGGSVAAWLFRIAHNEVVSHYRKQKPQVSIEAHDLQLRAGNDALDEAIRSAEEKQFLRQLTYQLTDEQQNLLSLKFNGQLTSAQIGEVLGKSASAVRTEVHRLLKHLRMLYEKEAQHEPRQ